MKRSIILFIAGLALLFLSCEKGGDDKPNPSDDTIQLKTPGEFLYNIPISGDTIFMDKDFGIDYRVEIEGFKIDSIKISVDNSPPCRLFTTIINTLSCYSPEGNHQISYLIYATKEKNGEKVLLRSGQFAMCVTKNLVQRFVKISKTDGRLKLVWTEFDKKNPKHYLIERYMGERQEFKQELELFDSTMTDHSYVGEEVYYKISVINQDGVKQNIWYCHKEKEEPVFTLVQGPGVGYTLHFSRCSYYNNFGQYYLTTGMNEEPKLLYSSASISDTLFHITDARFAEESRLWLRCLPKEYPSGISQDNWMPYGHFIYSRYGTESFQYKKIVSMGNHKVAYNYNGVIYERDLKTNRNIDSTVNQVNNYGLIKTTPAGDYIYAIVDEVTGSPVYFWPSNELSKPIKYTFQNRFVVPPVSDNLIAIMEIPGDIIPGKLGIYNITSGEKIFITPFAAMGNPPTISSDGQYIFINDGDLKLCRFNDNNLSVVWTESDWIRKYRYYNFYPNDDELCYTWDYNNKFSIMKRSDFTVINSFQLDVADIINIDFDSGKIMGYGENKILICSLADGSVLNDIPANMSELFFYNNCTLLVGNTVYSNHGIKYEILN